MMHGTAVAGLRVGIAARTVPVMDMLPSVGAKVKVGSQRAPSLCRETQLCRSVESRLRPGGYCTWEQAKGIALLPEKLRRRTGKSLEKIGERMHSPEINVHADGLVFGILVYNPMTWSRCPEDVLLRDSARNARLRRPRDGRTREVSVILRTTTDVDPR
jgi:hypothetical protein